MQKLDELIEARLQEKERESRSSPRDGRERRGWVRVPCLALGMMSLCLLALLVVWAFHSAGL
jgi:hypothetical protein